MIGRVRTRVGSVLLVLGALALVIAHGVVLYVGASRMRLPVVIVGGVLAFVVVKHLGLVGRLRALLHRRSRDRSD